MKEIEQLGLSFADNEEKRTGKRPTTSPYIAVSDRRLAGHTIQSTSPSSKLQTGSLEKMLSLDANKMIVDKADIPADNKAIDTERSAY